MGPVGTGDWGLGLGLDNRNKTMHYYKTVKTRHIHREDSGHLLASGLGPGLPAKRGYPCRASRQGGRGKGERLLIGQYII